jgi:hypothetical protein
MTTIIKEHESIDRMIKKFEIRSNFDSYNETTTIGNIYLQICNKTNLTMNDVINAIEEIYNLLESCRISIEHLEIIAERTLKNRTLSNGLLPSFDYLPRIFTNPSNQGVVFYLTNHCNQIPDFLEINNGVIKICDDEWFENHVKYIKTIIRRLETRQNSIQNLQNNLEALAIKKEQIRAKANEHFECECGGNYSRAHKSQHEKTKSHKEWVNQGKPSRNILSETKNKDIEIEKEIIKTCKEEEDVDKVETENVLMCVEILQNNNEIENNKEEVIMTCEVPDNKIESKPVKKNTKEYLSTIINCGCGVSHSRANTSNHRKTNGHQTWENTQKIQKENQEIKTDDNSVINCECGGTYTRKNKATHKKTAKHIRATTN